MKILVKNTSTAVLKKPAVQLSKLALAVSCCVAPAMAQEGVLEEILVTASKRGATSLMDTAVTARVVTGEQIDMRAIENVEGMQYQTPGMVVDQGSTAPKIAIRGVGHNSFLLTAESGVTIYSNDILLGRTQGILGAFFDQERVDVLKGPQGTAFGRNATGGSINFISRRPHEGMSVEVGVGGGNYGKQEAHGIFNYGGDTFGLRVGARYNEDDGYAENKTYGTDLNAVEQTIIKSGFSFTPSDNFDGLLRVDYTDEETTRSAQGIGGVEPFSPAVDVFGANGSFDEGEDYEVFNDVDPFQDTETLLTSLTLDWDIGGLNLRSITGFYTVDWHSAGDNDNTDIQFTNTPNYEQDSDQFTQEFVLSGSADTIDWLAGIYYLQEEVEQKVTIDFAPALNPQGGASEPG